MMHLSRTVPETRYPGREPRGAQAVRSSVRLRADRGARRVYLAVRSDGGPPAFLSKDSDETLIAAYPEAARQAQARPQP